jgi:hypothetical protein
VITARVVPEAHDREARRGQGAESLPAGALPFNLAPVYLGLGDRDRAIDRLEQAAAADSQMLGWLGYGAISDALCREPRCAELLKRSRFIP